MFRVGERGKNANDPHHHSEEWRCGPQRQLGGNLRSWSGEFGVCLDTHLRNIETIDLVFLSRANAALRYLVLNREESISNWEDHQQDDCNTKCLCT